MGSETIADGNVFEIEVEPAFAPYMAAAVLRISYVEQAFAIMADGSRFRVTARSPLERKVVERKIAHALYREKIRAESAPLRARFLELLSQR